MFDPTITTNFLIRSLLFIFIFFFSFKAFKVLFKDKGTSAIASLALSLMTLFYLNNSQVDFLFKDYGLTGSIILFLLPFMIALLFVYSSKINGLFRKLFWIFYGVMTVVIFQNTNSVSSESASTIIILFSILIISLVLFDTSIKDYFEIRKNLRRR